MTGKGLENFGQAVSQFNAAGGQNVARTVGDITEVALPAAITAIAAPELLPAVVIGEGASVGLGEGISKLTTGKWQSLPSVLQEANEGGVLGVIGGAAGSALEGGLTKLGTYIGGKAGDIIAGAGGKALAGAAVNEALTVPFTRNPEQLLLSGVLGAAGGAAADLIHVENVPVLEQSNAIRNALDTSEAGIKLGNELVNEGITKNILSVEEINGKTTTEIGGLLNSKASQLQNDILSKLSTEDLTTLKQKGIINDNGVVNVKEFADFVKDKLPEGKTYNDTLDLLDKYNKELSKVAGGFKLSVGDRTLLYKLNLGDERNFGFGSAGKSPIFNDIRSVSDLDANVAGIYGTTSDVRDTAIGLARSGSTGDSNLLMNVYKAAKGLKNIGGLKPGDLSLTFKDYIKNGDTTMSDTMGNVIKDYFSQPDFSSRVVFYGSNSMKQYLQDIATKYGGLVEDGEKFGMKDMYAIVKDGKPVWALRKPGDVDVFVKTDDPAELNKITQDLANLLNGATGTDRFVADGHLVIDRLNNGEHVVDVHMQNEVSDLFNFYARNPGGNLGMRDLTPNYVEEGDARLGIAKLSQMARTKGNAVAGLRNVSIEDVLEQINSGLKIDNNEDMIVKIVERLAASGDLSKTEDAISYFLTNIKDAKIRNDFAERFASDLGVTRDDLLNRVVNLNDIKDIITKKEQWISPASYRLKDAQDFLRLVKLEADLSGDPKKLALYESLERDFKARGWVPDDWKPEGNIDLSVLEGAQRFVKSIADERSPASIMSIISPLTSVSSIISSVGGSMGGIESGSIGSIGSGLGSLGSIGSPTVPSPSLTVYPPVYPPSPPPSLSLPLIVYPSSSLTEESVTPSPPPSVFSASSVTESESPLPMGPPPLIPAMMPGGFGGGGNREQEISGMAGEVIVL